jgi:hypothetical protein
MKPTPCHVLVLLLTLLTAAAGCSPTDRPGSGSDGGLNDGAPANAPSTLEVVINEVRFGPSTPTAGSGASLVNTRDPETGRVTSSAFRLFASSAESGASCRVSAHRSGNDVTPIGPGNYPFANQIVLAVSPIDGEEVTTPQGRWQCTGAGCNGTVFALNRIEASRVEGYISGTWLNSDGSSIASVFCSFDVPLTTYVP